MPQPESNSANLKFLKSIFKKEIRENYPDFNYRLRLAGLTEFEPYISEAARISEESDEQYKSRVATLGRLFGEQEILLNDIVHSEQNISGLAVNSTFHDGSIPETVLFLEECKLDETKKLYDVTAYNLNHLDFTTTASPVVAFPVDLSEDEKGYYIYRKTSAVQKNGSNNDKITEIHTGWEKVAEFSNNDLKSLLASTDLSKVGSQFPLGYIDSGISGYSGWTNELFTNYKILDSGNVGDPSTDTSYLSDARTLDFVTDRLKSYTVQRKINRLSNTADNPAGWEEIERQADFPYTDAEVLSDLISVEVSSRISGTYGVIEPTGVHSVADQDFFEIDLINDWGKAELKDYTFNQDSKELIFKSGESLKVTQKAFSDIPLGNQEILGSVEMSFSPHTTGISGSITGVNNIENFYELEYQLVPKGREKEKLYYEEVDSTNTLVRNDKIFLNTGIVPEVLYVEGETIPEGKSVGDVKTEAFYSPVRTNLMGAPSKELEKRMPFFREENQLDEPDDIGSTFVSGFYDSIEPKTVAAAESSGNGYSYFVSGEKYLVVPNGGYNSIVSAQPTLSYSAGEMRKTFYQGGQYPDGDEDLTQYALTEYRSYDPVDYSDEPYVYKKERELRISEQSLCVGDTSIDLADELLDSRRVVDPIFGGNHASKIILRNANILNINSLDGSIDVSNQKSNKEEFEGRTNLFFEKNYIGQINIMASDEKQDLSFLKEAIRTYDGDATVFYLERDVYIDSDIGTQANFQAPSPYPEKQGYTSPLSVDIDQVNPNSQGVEKLYLTQTYQKPKGSLGANGKPQYEYPFSDSDYYCEQPSVEEAFYYSNNSDFEDKAGLSLFNIDSIETYQANNFRCEAAYTEDKKDIDGHALLSYKGVVQGTVTTGDASEPAADKLAISFEPENIGVYYEIQARNTASTYNWTTVSPARDVYDTTLASFTIQNDVLASTHETLELRALEWGKGTITTNINGYRTTNESPDSLILRSAASDVLYDESKFEHNITKVGSTIETKSPDPAFSNTYYIDFNTDDENYFSFASHRSFDLMNGDFSIDFWIKNPVHNASRKNNIMSRGTAYDVSLVAGNKVKFKAGEETLTSPDLNADSWHHVAICAVTKGDVLVASLYVDGKVKESRDLSYDSLSVVSKNTELLVGRGLEAELYDLRLYVGKSNYKSDFTPPTEVSAKESNQLAYKILKYKSERKVNGSDWIINKNTFNNVVPPSSYGDDDSDEGTVHMAEWVSENLTSEGDTARVNYLLNEAYFAPNNPHINKNYEGTPIVITKDSSGNYKEDWGQQLNDIVYDTYKYTDYDRDTSRKDKKAFPYLYEYKQGDDLYLIRKYKKGGNNTNLGDKNVNAFAEGGRLRVSRYVYKLYTKTAVLVGDLGYKNSRSWQGGWTYKLQYSTDSGATWVNINADRERSGYNFFFNDEYNPNPSVNGFNNMDYVNKIPSIILQTDITRKYKPEDIKFRIRKRQNVSFRGGSLVPKVLKKLNFLPLEVNIPSSGCLLDYTQQGEHTEIEGKEAEVKLDPDRAYIVIKNKDEKVLRSSDENDTLKISSFSLRDLPDDPDDQFLSESEKVAKSFNASAITPLSNSLSLDEEEITDGVPVEIMGVTGLRIKMNNNSTPALNLIKTVIGPKPSGLKLDRVEKSYEGKSTDGYVRTGESFGLPFENTKAFITPLVTGSHFDELDDFNKFVNQPEDPTNSSILGFSCQSYTTGKNQSSLATGVSGVSYEPLNQFYNSPIMTGEFRVTPDDQGKTFLCSGSYANGIIEGNGYSFDTVNLDTSPLEFRNNPSLSSPVDATVATQKALTLTIKGDDRSVSVSNSLDVVTPIPTATLVYSNDIVAIQDAGKVRIVDGHDEESTGIINIYTGDITLMGDSAEVNDNVVFVEHGKIEFTTDDSNAGITGVIDSASSAVLPDTSANGEEITLFNATDYESKVSCKSSSHKIGAKKKNLGYISRDSAKKFTYNAGTWTETSVDITRFNQLSLTDANFHAATGDKLIVHNEDVDVRITDTEIDDGAYINIVRSQINNFDLEDDKSLWKTPILRIFVDEVLLYIAPKGCLGLRVEKASSAWRFTKIEPIIYNEISLSNASGGKVFLYSGADEAINIKFSGLLDGYDEGFKVYLISNRKRAADIGIDVYYVGDDSVKFIDELGNEIDYRFRIPMSNKSLVSISRSSEGRNFVIKSEDQTNIYSFLQPTNAGEIIKINRNDDFGLELPVVDENTTNKNIGFDAIFCNFAETKCDSFLPKEAFADKKRKSVGSIPSFGITAYKYKSFVGSSTFYDNFQSDSSSQSYSQEINAGDSLILDGSIDAVKLRSALGSRGNEYYQAVSQDHKFSKTRYKRDFSWFYGEAAKYISQSDAGVKSDISQNENDALFTLPNHELSTGQKLVLVCDKVIVADWFFVGHPYDINSSGTIYTGTNAKDGDIILVYDGSATNEEFYSYHIWDDAAGRAKPLTIDLPLSMIGKASVANEILLSDIEGDRLLMYIRQGSGNGTDDLGLNGTEEYVEDKVYDLSDRSSVITLKNNAYRIETSDDDSDDRAKAFFVKVINENQIKLYHDSLLTIAEEYSEDEGGDVDKNLLSESFYVENVDVSKLNLINFGSDTNVNTYSEDSPIGGLDSNKHVSLQEHGSNIYTSGDASPPGVYLASGWDPYGGIDTLDIDGLSDERAVFLSRKFHARGDLTNEDDSSENFDGNYYVNAGLDEVVITDDEDDGQTKLEKNKAYKHTSDGAFEVQDQNDTYDIVYYPKNELHVIDRKYLGKNSRDNVDNFVFFKPDRHSDGLKIVLPDTWTNLDGKIAVVNLHTRPVAVSSFSGLKTFTLAADTVAFMTNDSDYGTAHRAEYNIYDKTTEGKITFDYLGSTYGILLDEGSSEATVTVNSVSEKFYILKPGDITLDHSIHHEKTILADGPVNFLRPYLNSNTGTDYTTSNKYNQDTAFYIVNISRDPVQLLINNEEDAYVASEGKMHSLERYAVELSEFIVSEQTDGYFKHITTEINPEIAFAYPGTLLDHLKKYNIFGIELALKLNIYTEEISEGDAFKLNSYFEPSADDMIEAGEYYKIGGIGAADVRNLNIINTTYENVKIGSVSVKESLADNAALEAKIKALFDERQVVMQDQFYRWSVDTAGGKEFDTYSGQSIVPKFLSKNKTLALGVNELLTPNYLAVASDVGGGYTSIGCSAFGGEDLLVPSEVLAMNDAVVLSFLLKINTNLGARILKKQSVEASLFSSKTDGARSITGFSDDVDIVLPKRRLIRDGFSFVIINGSRSSRTITSCEGIDIDNAASLSIAAASAKKITLSSGEFTSSDITVEELNNGLYSTDLKAFVLTKGTDENYLINKTDGVKFINNTGKSIKLKAKGSSEDYVDPDPTKQSTNKNVGAANYADVICRDDDSTVTTLGIANGNDSEKFVLIKDGAANISRAAYENKVVLFNSERVRHFIQSDTTKEDSFFSTFFVPFLNATKVKKDDDKIARMYGYPVSYNVENDKATSSSERVGTAKPILWDSTGGVDKIIEVTCHLFEFILGASVQGKIIAPKKDYHYIFPHQEAFSKCTLYNRFSYSTNFYKLDANGVVEINKDADDNVSAKMPADSFKGRFAVGLSNNSSNNIKVANQQTYNEVEGLKYEIDGEQGPLDLHQFFYLNKDAYNDKIIVFKDPFIIVKDGYAKESATPLANISKGSCYYKDEFKEEVDRSKAIPAEHYYSFDEDSETGSSQAIVRPQYDLTADASKVYVLRHAADVVPDTMTDLQIVNISRSSVEIKDSATQLSKRFVYSSERAHYISETLEGEIDEDNQGTEILGEATYSEVRRWDRRDWFIRLVDTDIPHLIKDKDYYNDREREVELQLGPEAVGKINVEYKGNRYKLSNIFRTNKVEPAEFQNGYQTIENFNDPYRYGITLLTDRKGKSKDLFFSQDVSDMGFPLYLKLPWDMPQRVIAYMLSTGHERLSSCPHLDERTGEMTFRGISKDKYYILDAEKSSSYDFTYNCKGSDDVLETAVSQKQYAGIIKNKTFKPTVTYGGKSYEVGKKFKGLPYKVTPSSNFTTKFSEYKLSYPYFSTFRLSQFSAGSVKDSILDVNNSFIDEKVDINGVVTKKSSDSFEGIKEGLIEIDKKVKENISWDKVSKISHQDHFVNGSIDNVVEKTSSESYHELIKGRRVKDIKGKYSENELIATEGFAESFGEYKQTAGLAIGEKYISRVFKFEVPLKEGFHYIKKDGEQEYIEIINYDGGVKSAYLDSGNASQSGAVPNDTVFIAEKGDTARVTLVFRRDAGQARTDTGDSLVGGNILNVNSPGYEHKIGAELQYDKSKIAEGKSILEIDLSQKNSTPFVPDGVIRSLNLDYDGSERSEVNGGAYVSLKNNVGHSFIPFGMYQANMVGLRFNLERDRGTYESVRFRLKKQTESIVIFEDLAFNEKIGPYLTDHAETANLHYFLNTEVEEISYQDIVRPGGVARLKYKDWEAAKKSGSYQNSFLVLGKVDDGDAIVFKESNGSIVAGRPYFIRFSSVSESSGSTTYKVDVLSIYRKEADLDGVLKVTGSIEAGDKYKIVNYFNLSAEGETGHRSKTPIIDKVYPERTQRGDETYYPTLNFPIIIGSKKFYLERPSKVLDPAQAGSAADRIWTRTGSGFEIRTNLELSEIANAWVTNEGNMSDREGGTGSTKEAVTSIVDTFGHSESWTNEEQAARWAEGFDSDGYPTSMNLFVGFKNLLYRTNAQVEMAEYFDKDNEVVMRVVIHLNKNKEYRCVFDRSSQTTSDVYDEEKEDYNPLNYMRSITINNEVVSTGTPETAMPDFYKMFDSTSGTVEVEMSLTELGIVNRKPGEGEEYDDLYIEEVKNKILANLYSCFSIIESAGYVDQIDNDGKPIDYFDYQIPRLNNELSSDYFKHPDDFYYTEGLDLIVSEGDKNENLTDSKGGLRYNGSMPAGIRYIYPRPVDITEQGSKEGFVGKALAKAGQSIEEIKAAKGFVVDISPNYWFGFLNGFLPPDTAGAPSGRTKPTSIKFEAQIWNGSVWGKIENFPKDHIDPSDGLGTAPASVAGIYGRGANNTTGFIHYEGVDITKSYRFKILEEVYRKYSSNAPDSDKGYEEFTNKKEDGLGLRVPLSWSSVVLASDISDTSEENTSTGEREYALSLVENPLLKGSVAFPHEGFTKFGVYEHEKELEGYGIVPYTRLYKYGLRHTMSASYYDPLQTGGISKVVITDPGNYYKFAPTATVAIPAKSDGTQVPDGRAELAPSIESKKLRFIEVVNAGYGYVDLGRNKKKYINYTKGVIPVVYHSLVVQEAKFTDATCVTQLNSNIVSHSGGRAMVLGARVSGAGIPGGSITVINKIISSTQFKITKHATAAASPVTLTFDSTEREMAFINEFEHLSTIPVSISPIVRPRVEQEVFGVIASEAELMEEYSTQPNSTSKNALKGAVSALTNYVKAVVGATENPNWLDVNEINKKINQSNAGSEEVASEASARGYPEEEEGSVSSGSVKRFSDGTESSFGSENTGSSEHGDIDGLYVEHERDKQEEASIEVTESGDTIFESYPDPRTEGTIGSAVAIINDNTLAEYRVIDNEYANKAQPWFSSFSREQNPALPKSFGIWPGSPVTAEVFNQYARAVNNLYLMAAEVPVYARVRKYRKYEYRYLSDMAGLTFLENDPKDAGNESGSSYDYMIWDDKSKINYVSFEEDGIFKNAWFSADFGTVKRDDTEEPQNITNSDITDTDQIISEYKKENEGSIYTPKDIGLPTIVNFPTKKDSEYVHCDPSYGRLTSGGKAEGLNLPRLDNKRASAYGGPLVFASESYDISDEDFRLSNKKINIRNPKNHDVISSSFKNEIVFGCQFKGKPFWGVFLKTTREWTEYDIEVNSSFGSELLTDISGALNAPMEGITVNTVIQSVECSNETFSKVGGDNTKHSLCMGGRKTYVGKNSYEEAFGLSEGDDVIGPQEKELETQGTSLKIQPKGTYIIEPEFPLALAVYGSHDWQALLFGGATGTVAIRGSLGYFGPCIHSCSPSVKQIARFKDESFVFNLKKETKPTKKIGVVESTRTFKRTSLALAKSSRTPLKAFGPEVTREYYSSVTAPGGWGE